MFSDLHELDPQGVENETYGDNACRLHKISIVEHRFFRFSDWRSKHRVQVGNYKDDLDPEGQDILPEDFSLCLRPKLPQHESRELGGVETCRHLGKDG